MRIEERAIPKESFFPSKDKRAKRKAKENRKIATIILPLFYLMIRSVTSEVEKKGEEILTIY